MDAAPSKASRASVWWEVREENYTDPSHPLPALLGVSQTALCASLRRVPGPVSRCLIISTHNTNEGERGRTRAVLCGATKRGPSARSQLHRYLNYGACASALPPQAGKILPEVVIEVVGSG